MRQRILQALFEERLQLKFELPPSGPPPGSAQNAMPPPPQPDTAPSLFTALQEQLGVKLESQKGPVEVIGIRSH